MNSAANVSELLSAAALNVLLLAGIIWSLRRALRSGGERWCGLSLTALLSGLLVSGLGQVLKDVLPPAAYAAIIGVALVVLLIGPILAIGGLARRQAGQAGLGQAIASLVRLLLQELRLPRRAQNRHRKRFRKRGRKSCRKSCRPRPKRPSRP
jgi:heme A synthase